MVATVGGIAKLQWETFVVLKLKAGDVRMQGVGGVGGRGAGLEVYQEPNAQPTLVKNSNFCSCLLGASFFPESVLK